MDDCENTNACDRQRRSGIRNEWVHLDLNQGPTGYEPVALTTELWTLMRTLGAKRKYTYHLAGR